VIGACMRIPGKHKPQPSHQSLSCFLQMASVTGRIADRKENQTVLSLRTFEDRLSPRIPVNRIVNVM